MRNLFTFVLFLAFALEVLSGSASAQEPYREIKVDRGGSIRGNVRFTGNVAAVKELSINRDVQSCGNLKTLQFLVLGKNQGVQNAVISLEGITAGKTWTKAPMVTLTQDKCEYHPHVMLVPLGSQLEILNNDDILHNVHTYEMTGELKTLFNVAQPIKGLKTHLVMENPGYIVATCDAGHPWMSGYIKVLDQPYTAITDADGNFTIDNVPPGSYKLTMWHEPITVGSEAKMENMQPHYLEKPIVVTKDVTVSAGTPTSVSFEFK